jgi:putative transposase
MKKQHIKLSPEDKLKLEGHLSKGKHSTIVFKRIMGLQKLDSGMTFIAVSKELKVSYPTVINWASKYTESGLVFLKDKQRPGRPVLFDGEERAKITALACSEAPAGHAKWTLRLLATKLVELEFVSEISHTEVRNILKKTNFNLIENANGALEH